MSKGEKQFTLYKTLELKAICKRCRTVVYIKGTDDEDLAREFDHLLGLHVEEGCMQEEEDHPQMKGSE